MSSATVAKMRQQLGNLLAAFAVPLKPILRAGQRHFAADEREPLAFQQLRRASLAVVLDQLRLVVEQIELRRRADHVQVDHVLGLRRKVRRPGGERIRRLQRELDAADSSARSSELSAIAPRPIPDPRRNWRRDCVLKVLRRADSSVDLALGNRFVQVQQSRRDGIPRGQLFARRRRSAAARRPIKACVPSGIALGGLQLLIVQPPQRLRSRAATARGSRKVGTCGRSVRRRRPSAAR